MKLFRVEFADETHIQVAKSPDDAITQVQKKTNIDFLPYTSSEIDLGEYMLVAKKEMESMEALVEIPFSEPLKKKK